MCVISISISISFREVLDLFWKICYSHLTIETSHILTKQDFLQSLLHYQCNLQGPPDTCFRSIGKHTSNSGGRSARFFTQTPITFILLISNDFHLSTSHCLQQRKKTNPQNHTLQMPASPPSNSRGQHYLQSQQQTNQPTDLHSHTGSCVRGEENELFRGSVHDMSTLRWHQGHRFVFHWGQEVRGEREEFKKVHYVFYVF